MALGFKPFIIEQSIAETADIRTLVLKPEDGSTLPPHKPGQFYNLKPSGLPEGFRPLFRSYSAMCTHRPGRVAFGIKRHGPFSTHITSMKPGDRVEVAGPYGVFGLPAESTEHMVFLAGGIGITPLMCMIEHLAESGHSKPFFLFYSNKTEADTAYRKSLERFSEQNAHLKIIYTLTGENTPEGWNGERGRINVDMMRKHGVDLGQAMFFFCGPVPFVDGLKKALSEAGVEPKRLVSEKW